MLLYAQRNSLAERHTVTRCFCERNVCLVLVETYFSGIVLAEASSTFISIYCTVASKGQGVDQKSNGKISIVSKIEYRIVITIAPIRFYKVEKCLAGLRL